MSLKGREIFLIDGNSLAYRAFFALPETLATSKGEPSNAIFGFATMLVKILTEYGQRATIVVWDAGMSGRELEYEPYKEQRKPRPDLLVEQWPHLEEMVDAFGYQNVSVEGYEADDVIASIAEEAKKKGIGVTVVTGDRDAYQLVEDESVPIRVMTTTRGISETKTYDREAVVERYGVGPELVPDLIGLKGDSSDNIPGVPGIGEKTASKLLKEYGSLEGVLGNVDEVSGDKRRQNLREFAEQAKLSKRLATLKRDIDYGVELNDVLAQTTDTASVQKFFNQFELRDPLRRVEQELDSGSEDGRSSSTEVEGFEEGSLSDIKEFASEGGASLAVEVDGDEISWAACAGDDRALRGTSNDLAEIADAWGGSPLIAHDYKSMVELTSVEPSGAAPLPEKLDHDTMIAAYLLNPTRRRYPLEELVEQEGIGVDNEGKLDLCGRARATLALAGKQREMLAERGLEKLFLEVEMPLVGVLADLELVGVKLDTYRLGEISAKVEEQLEELQHGIWEIAGEEFTIGSPKQLAGILFEKLGLSRKRRGKTGYSTDARVLKAIREESPIVPKVERWRELSKLKNTYIDALPDHISPKSGRLHTTFNQAATATGRLSSTDPNLQNIPVRTQLGKEIRDCFVAEEGKLLIAADYSQVELRLLAQIADEIVLKEIFARGEDVHTTTAAEVFNISPEEVGTAERAKAKAVNYGIVYGLSAHGLSEQLDVSYEEAQEFIDRYLGRFPAVRKFIDETVSEAKEQGYVKTMLGRVRDIPELRSRQPQTRSLGERLAVNTVLQGTAADVIKVAMIDCHRELRMEELGTRLVLQIHDELLFEGPEEEADKAGRLIRRLMESAYEIDPPLRVDLGTGRTWLTAKA